MKKVLWTLNINNYEPDICELTYPYLKKYADKIGADFKIITERKFPNMNVTYEKLQVYELGKDNDYNIFIDSDALIHPDFWDITEVMPKNYCFHVNQDFASIRWKFDKYFRRDGRHIGACNWFVVSTKKTHKLWQPLELSKEEIEASINLTNFEKKTIELEPGHLSDDYALSRNIAKYKLNHMVYNEILVKYPLHLSVNGEWWYHDYSSKSSKKIETIQNKIKEWNL